jgi:hypothetical protein
MNDYLVSEDDHIALTRLVTELVWRIDHGRADEVDELFTNDGEMTLGPTSLHGRSELKEWGRARNDSPSRTHHVCTNMRFVRTGDDQAAGTTILTVYLANAASTNQTTPAAVGEYQDRFVRTPEGWQFASRRSDPTFTRV